MPPIMPVPSQPEPLPGKRIRPGGDAGTGVATAGLQILVRLVTGHKSERLLRVADIAEISSIFPCEPRRYDNKASDLTKAGMEEGVSKTGCFLLFLSSGVMQRPYVQVGIFVARCTSRRFV